MCKFVWPTHVSSKCHVHMPNTSGFETEFATDVNLVTHGKKLYCTQTKRL